MLSAAVSSAALSYSMPAMQMWSALRHEGISLQRRFVRVCRSAEASLLVSLPEALLKGILDVAVPASPCRVFLS